MTAAFTLYTILSFATAIDISSLPLPPATPPPLPRRGFFDLSTAARANASLPDGPFALLDAHLRWPGLPSAAPAAFFVAPGLVRPSEVASLLSLLRPHAARLDADADSVDGKATQEIYLEKDGSAEGVARIAGKPDADPAVRASRAALRAALLAVTRPIQARRLAPLVQARFPAACAPAPCRVCHSLVRRYAQGERLEHPQHFDVQALVTVVVPLSTAGADFEGGLYVSTGATGREALLPLAAGDAVVHQSNLLHGVAVGEGGAGERWSWITWYKNVPAGASCDAEDGSGWAAAGAAGGDPVATFLHARRARSPAAARELLRRSAEAGFARAANELGHALRAAARSEAEGVRWLRVAAAAGEPEGLHNLAVAEVGARGGGNATLAVALWGEAARLGLAAAAANVAVAFFGGRGGVAKDPRAAAAWWQRAGDGESLQLAAQAVEAEGGDGAPLWARAARVGHVPAAEELARRALAAAGARGGPAAARPWLQRAARGGSAWAAAQLERLGEEAPEGGEAPPEL
jgi:hypothetical protein